MRSAPGTWAAVRLMPTVALCVLAAGCKGGEITSTNNLPCQKSRITAGPATDIRDLTARLTREDGTPVVSVLLTAALTVPGIGGDAAQIGALTDNTGAVHLNAPEEAQKDGVLGDVLPKATGVRWNHRFDGAVTTPGGDVCDVEKEVPLTQ